jgi:hypothetical protein
MATVVLLGPQRFTPTLGEAVAATGFAGRLASVTAGWQEREGEDLELHEHLGERTVNLMLYARAEDAFERDPELFAAHRERQGRLRELQALYRSRLVPTREAARQLLEKAGDPELLEPERTDALAALASLDAHHLSRVEAIDREFDSRFRPQDRPAVSRHRQSIDRVLSKTAGFAIAGGHVAVLINRLRLFGLGAEIAARPLFAWSAGAMAVAERIVLFHDTPPQGAGVPEVLETGLGVVRGVLPMPHARRRLKLDEPTRVELHARRFAPDVAVALDDGARVVLENGNVVAATGARRLTASGAVEPLEAEPLESAPLKSR